MTAPALYADLADLDRQVAAVEADFRDLVSGLDGGAFNWREAPGRWSIGECVAHLNTTGRQYLAGIDDAIGDARSRGATATGPFRYGWLGSTFVRLSEPPAKIKVKAPKVFVPPPDVELEAASAEFLRLQGEIRERLRAADGLDLARVKAVSPVSARIRFSLYHAFALVVAHERRHLWQARRAREAPGFPSR